ncbi:MAG: peptidylprolyl isomerase [Actinobacteria bacterium]|nr:peptidylprolyl isomerase [Actinomycetota bacterium]MBL7123657.1 peptidylprolyl isomerase [Actinomycetota bacterium]
MKRVIICVIMLLIFVFLFAGCSKTVAKVDGIEIKQKEVDAYMNSIKSQDTSGEITSDEEKLNALEADIIDSLIIIKLLEKYAEENNITVTDEEVNEQVKLLMDTYSSEKDFEKDLKEKGINKRFLEGVLRSQLLSSKIYNKVTADVIVTEEAVKQYYEDNKNTLFLVPARVKASHILVMFPWKEDNSEETQEGREEALEKIKMVEDKLNDGGDFEDLARQYSDDGTSGENGGDLGYISKGQMVEEFDKALFSLDVGEVSEIVETEYGFHIIKATDREEEYIQKFDEVEESINTYLLNLHKAEKWEDFIFSLIEEVNIEYFTDVEGTLNSTDTGTEDNTDIETEEESE